VKHSIGSYPRVRVQDDGRQVVSQAGSVLLVETVRKTGLDQAMSQALAPWRKPRAVHDPGKALLDWSAPAPTVPGWPGYWPRPV
jgi:Transposase DDE domain group 1